MSIPISKPDEDLDNCAFCGAITFRWTALPDRTPGEQVACCVGCAKSKSPKDVPTKAEWFGLVVADWKKRREGVT